MLLTGALNWMYGAYDALSKEYTNLVPEQHFYILSFYIMCVWVVVLLLLLRLGA